MVSYLRRSAEQEEAFKNLGLKLVFKAKTQKELDKAVQKLILEASEYQALPTFRQYGVLQFVEGVARGTAKLVGAEGGGKFRAPSPTKPDDAPRAVKKLQPDAIWHRHPNGQGWVSNTAYVETTAHVGAKAVVCENARVIERASVYGTAVVRGAAECRGIAQVHGLAIVGGNARVFDAARILGRVRIGGSVKVGGTTIVRGTVVLDGEEELIDTRIAPKRVKTKTAEGPLVIDIG